MININERVSSIISIKVIKGMIILSLILNLITGNLKGKILLFIKLKYIMYIFEISLNKNLQKLGRICGKRYAVWVLKTIVYF